MQAILSYFYFPCGYCPIIAPIAYTVAMLISQTNDIVKFYFLFYKAVQYKNHILFNKINYVVVQYN